MDIKLYEMLFVLSFVIPGLLYYYIGYLTWRKEWVAIWTGTQATPWFILHVLLVYTDWNFEDVILQAGYGEIEGSLFVSYGTVQTIRWITVLPIVIYVIYIHKMGQIVILRGRSDIVIKAVEQILDNHRWGYTRGGDEFHVPSIDMRVQINWTETSGVVGIRTRCRDRDWKELFQENIMNTFKGRPSERYHPAYMIVGGVFLGIGIFLGVLIAMA